MAILILLRHAQAEPARAVPRDFDRKLTPTGKLEAGSVARWLASRHSPSLVVSSAAPRAHETAALLAAAAGAATKHVVEQRLYEAHGEDVLQMVRKFPHAAKTCAVVGHEPGLHEAASTLVQREIRLEPGGFVVLRLPSWEDAGPGARVLAHEAPDTLP